MSVDFADLGIFCFLVLLTIDDRHRTYGYAKSQKIHKKNLFSWDGLDLRARRESA